MSKYIAKYMNLEKSKQPIFWNGGSTCYDNWFHSESINITSLSTRAPTRAS